MNTLFFAFIILCLGLYFARRIVDSIFDRFKLFPQENKVFNPKAEAINELLESIPPDFSSPTYSVINNYELESVSSEGVQAIAEVVAEHITTVFEAS